MKRFAMIALSLVILMASLPLAMGVAAEEHTDGDFVYSVADGEATIVQYTGKQKTVKIPDKLGGCPVVAIGKTAFSDAENLTEVTFPKTLETIGGNAFARCKKLKKVDFPKSIREIGGHAFAWCVSLTSVEIPGSVSLISQGLFDSCWGIKKITLHEGVTEIDISAFYACNALEVLVLPKSLKRIQMYAVSAKLKTVYYAGSKAQMEKIQFTAEGNENLEKAEWVFNYQPTKPTTKPTTKSTTKPTSKPTTESTTEPTTKPTTESTTASTTASTTTSTTESTTVPTAVTAEPVPKKPDVWPIVAAGGAVLLIAAGVAAFLLGRRK